VKLKKKKRRVLEFTRKGIARGKRTMKKGNLCPTDHHGFEDIPGVGDSEVLGETLGRSERSEKKGAWP